MHRDEINIGFLDLLFNLWLGFVVLFLISFIMINVKAQKKSLESKIEFMITVKWDLDSPNDVDTWLQDPLGNVCWFQKKSVGLVHLDRDDLGNINDTITLPSGEKIVIPYNQELTSIRGFIPGEWLLNIHMYNLRNKKPTTVEVKMEKVNPAIKMVVYKIVKLVRHWQEETVVRFSMTAEGDIHSVDYEGSESLVNKFLSIADDPSRHLDYGPGP